MKRPLPFTGCPSVPGYKTVTDYSAMGVNPTQAVTEESFEAAKAACDANPNCTQFNNAFEMYMTLPLRYKSTAGICTYIKSTGCPDVSGYWVLPTGATWNTDNAQTKSVNVGSAAAAKAACDGDSNCLNWNSQGWVATGSYEALEYVEAASPTVCTYAPDPCPTKFGFWSFYKTSLAPNVGEDGVNFGSLGNQEDAEAYCKITPKCTAFSSGGNYAVGGWRSSDVINDKCVYVKTSCPVLVNYTAYDYIANDRSQFPPSGHYPSLCFADMARNCTSDPECKVFDTLRYVWNIDVVQFNDYPGMCVYRKVDGLLPSNTAYRRRSTQESAADGGSGGDAEGTYVPLKRVLLPYGYRKQAMQQEEWSP